MGGIGERKIKNIHFALKYNISKNKTIRLSKNFLEKKIIRQRVDIQKAENKEWSNDLNILIFWLSSF